ncbi:MAG: hypothetical protein WCU88_05640 [Elusimicrobiota bacterium]|jgi:hypothetical protein
MKMKNGAVLNLFLVFSLISSVLPIQAVASAVISVSAPAAQEGAALLASLAGPLQAMVRGADPLLLQKYPNLSILPRMSPDCHLDLALAGYLSEAGDDAGLDAAAATSEKQLRTLSRLIDKARPMLVFISHVDVETLGLVRDGKDHQDVSAALSGLDKYQALGWPDLNAGIEKIKALHQEIILNQARKTVQALNQDQRSAEETAAGVSSRHSGESRNPGAGWTPASAGVTMDLVPSSLRHSGESRNPGAGWIPASAGVTTLPSRKEKIASGLSSLRYEAKRLVLSAIAGIFGTVLSLPAADAALEQRILAQAAQKQAVFTDYDDTLEKLKQVASPETVEAMLALRGAGKQIVVVTDRPDKARDGSTKGTLVESLSSIPSSARGGMVFAVDKGGRILRYDGKGEPELIYEEPALDSGSAALIKESVEALKARLPSMGVRMHDGSKDIPVENLYSYGYALMLHSGTSESAVRSVAEALQEELQKRGLAFTVEPRMPKDPSMPPYVAFSKLNKSLAVSRIAGILGVSAEHALILGDSMFVPAAGQAQGLWGFLARWALRLGEWLSGSPIQAMGNGTDRDMEKALPGALTLSVGGTADPRMKNAYVLAGKGPEITRKILRAVANH